MQHFCLFSCYFSISQLSAPRTHSFPPMNSNNRRLVHDIAVFYNCSSRSYDQEPKRSTVVTATKLVSYICSCCSILFCSTHVSIHCIFNVTCACTPCFELKAFAMFCFKVIFTRMLFSEVPLAAQGPRIMTELQ